jgi:8-oxo-dGTP pyrophosphatase MutT (NUDIX family)
MGRLDTVRRQGFRLAYIALRLYWFVARPAARGVKCVLTNGDRVLLVRHTYGPSEWQLPGGTVKRSEPPVLAAQREIGEELGITIENWDELGALPAPLHHRRDTLYCFRAAVKSASLELDRAEIERAQWFEQDALPENLGRYVRQILLLAR